MPKAGIKQIAVNRQARHEYFVEESLEAGIELFGTEVKSMRCGGVNLKDAWCDFEGLELFVKQMHISPYEKGNIFNKDPLRPKRLLLHKRELRRLYGLTHPHPPPGLLQGRTGEAGNRPLQGQKALRQAGRRRQAGGSAGH